MGAAGWGAEVQRDGLRYRERQRWSECGNQCFLVFFFFLQRESTNKCFLCFICVPSWSRASAGSSTRSPPGGIHI